MTNDYYKTFIEHRAITYEFISETIAKESNQDERYIVLMGYTSIYDGGEIALDLDRILNYMNRNGFEFIQYVNNPYVHGKTEIVFKRM